MIEHIQNGFDECIVVFSPYQFNNDSKKFTFYNNLNIYFEKFDFLFVMDETNRWYNYEYGSIQGKNINETKKSLEKVLKNYKKISLIGSSMGGYASLLYSTLSNVDRVIAIAPQIFLKKGWPRYSQSNLNGKKILELSQNKLKIHKLLFFIGLDDIYDVYQGLCFFGNGKMLMENATIVPNSYHNISLYFLKRNTLDRLFALIMDKGLLPGCSPYEKNYSYEPEIYNLLMAKDFKYLLDTYYNEYFSGNTTNALNIAYSLYLRAPNWLGMQRIYGVSLFLEKKYNESLEILSKVSQSLFIDDIYYALCFSCFYLGKYNQMFEYIMKVKKINEGEYNKIYKEILEALKLLDTKDKYIDRLIEINKES